jgi:hypothetical protein
VAAVQHTFTHKQNTENGTYITRTRNKRKKIWKSGLSPVFACYTLAFALQLREKHGKTSARLR